MKTKSLTKYFILATLILLPLLASCSKQDTQESDTALNLPEKPATAEQPPQLPPEEAMPLPPSGDSKPEGSLFG